MADLRAGGRPRAPRPMPERPTPERPPVAARPPVGTRPPSEIRPPVGSAAAAERPRAVPRSRPDPRPIRIAIGMGALATASALVTALTAPAVGPAAQTGSQVVAVDPTPAVRHVIQYVQLKPGQTAPPQAMVKAAPTPKPRVVIVTTTRQSGAKP